MGFFATLGFWAASQVLGSLLRRDRDVTAIAEPGELELPTARAGGAVPVIWGTVKVAPNVVWVGTPTVTPIRYVPTFEVFGLTFTGEEIVRHEHYVPMQLAICHGAIDRLLDIRFGEYSLKDYVPEPGGILPSTSSVPALPVDRAPPYDAFLHLVISAQNLFGGYLISYDGGVFGQMKLYWGLEDQPTNAFAASRSPKEWVGQVPLSGICHAIFENTQMGLTGALKPIYFVVARFPTCLLNDPEVAEIDGDANPAEMLFEVMTDYRFGLNIPVNLIDLVSFIDAAHALKDEGTGLSMQVTDQTDGETLIGEILRHIDAVLYTDPVSGLIGLKLIRADYVEDELPVFGPDDYEELEFSRGSWRETINEVKVVFTDRELDFNPDVAQAQNLAAVQAVGDVISETYQFPGISNASHAQRVVERLMRTVSVPMAKASFRTKRSAYRLKTGDPFVLVSDDLGIGGMVMRVIRINYGSLTDGQIEIDAVQDAFDTTGLAYAPPQPGTGGFSDDPTLEPQPFVRQAAIEAPYWLVGGEERHLLVAGSRPSGVYSAWEAHLSVNGGAYALAGVSGTFVPSGLLEQEYSALTGARDETGFVITATRDISLLSPATEGQLFAGANLALIGEEIVAWKSIESLGGGRYRIYGVLRGVMDTVPATHDALSQVLFFSTGGFLVPDLYDGGLVADLDAAIKLRPINANGELDLAEAPATELTTASRAFVPAPPGNVKLNDLGYDEWPEVLDGESDAVITWSHRNRLEQGTQANGDPLIRQDEAGAYTLEGTYTVEVYLVELDDEYGVIYHPQAHRTAENLTDATFTYALTERQADDADKSLLVEIRITPIGDYGEVGRTRRLPWFLMEEEVV